ncbi:hypothetical protein VNO80_13275 [Phaseolus coccineus]|uniref:Uncharacterized protein n=1 Tax=Phaseolus coccineus TaxID=3886 RepID=A0AAN9N757_PHACN
MSSSVESSGSVDSSVTRTASGGASESSDGPSYDWVDPSVLNVSTKIKTSDDLDKFCSANPNFIEPDCPGEALVADVCGMTDRDTVGKTRRMTSFFRSGNVRFAPYTTSYKNFKDSYFKIFVELDGRDFFYNADGTTKFPFHWIEKPC